MRDHLFEKALEDNKANRLDINNEVITHKRKINRESLLRRLTMREKKLQKFIYNHLVYLML